MLKVGLTGGIGSGKSVVAKIFAALGVPVYYADDAARRIQQEDPAIVQQITALLGEQAYLRGVLNRPYVAEIVFADKAKLAALNAIVHPATIRDAAQWLAEQTTPYAIKEAALIFESGSQHDLDYVIGVTAPLPLRIQRTMKRDGISEKEVVSRINRQMDETEKMRLCHTVIINDERQLLVPQVLELHQSLLSLSREASPHLSDT